MDMTWPFNEYGKLSFSYQKIENKLNLTEVCQILLNVQSENTHRWGKDHCMAGLQFYKVALDCFTKYK